jgi:polysaccharide biosynthesis/export protein
MAKHPTRWAALAALTLVCAGSAGCVSCQSSAECCDNGLPRELAKTAHSPYTIEPPDILLIDALRVIPLPPYRVEPLDSLVIQANALATAPIGGIYPVETDGTVNLGFSYGSVRVVGMTLPEAKTAIEEHLKKDVVKPEVQVYLGQSRALQQIRGEHLVRQDGTVGLGSYGDVSVVGKTLPEAKAEIEAYLAKYLLNPEVSVDVYAFNSKVFYVIYDGGGSGQQITRLPVTGNETVLDAVSKISGLPAVADKRRIWVARPVPACSAEDQILPVDWCAVTKRGRTETNYQLFPGDRLYVEAEPLVTLDTALARIISPIERVFGGILLGNATVQSFNPINGSNGSNGTGLGVGTPVLR